MVDVIELLDKLVSYDTRTARNQAGPEVKELLQNEIVPIFDELGLTHQFFESEGHHSILGHKSGTKPCIFYSGHIDVVPWDDAWDTDPMKLTEGEKDGKSVVSGRGVVDMKGGVAAIMAALPKLIQTDAELYFGFTGDEEIGGNNGTRVLVDHLEKHGALPDYVITADAAGMEIVTRRRNAFVLESSSSSSSKKRIKVVGKKKSIRFETEIMSADTSHAAYFKREIDSHCLANAARFVVSSGALPSGISGKFVKSNVLPKWLSLEFVVPDESGTELEYDEGLVVQLELAAKLADLDFETEAHSDLGVNCTSNVLIQENDQWIMQTDIRAMLSQDAKPLHAAVEKIIASIDGEIAIELKKSVGYISTPDDSVLAKAACGLISELGYDSNTTEKGGATDGRFFGSHGVPVIDVGPIGWNVHGPNETATIDSLRKLVTFFENITERLVNLHNAQQG